VSTRGRLTRRTVGFMTAVVVVAVVGSLGAIQYGTAATGPASDFRPTSPSRILDTRGAPDGPIGVAAAAPLRAAQIIDLQVTGVAGVPANATSVVLNVTVTAPTDSSFLTLWPSGETRPTASNLNWVANRTIPNLVTVQVGAGGKISLYNFLGTAHVIADLAGYYVGAPDVYSKVEVDQKISVANVFDPTQYYTKAVLDGAGATARYTKGEEDGKFATLTGATSLATTNANVTALTTTVGTKADATALATTNATATALATTVGTKADASALATTNATATALATTVGGHTTSIGSLTTTVGGHTTSIGALTAGATNNVTIVTDPTPGSPSVADCGTKRVLGGGFAGATTVNDSFPGATTWTVIGTGAGITAYAICSAA
jgi:hypothetical protein